MIWRICYGCPALNGVEKVIRQRNTLNWVAVQRPIVAVDSMINRAHFGLWASKQSTVYSTGASIRWCIVNVMTGTTSCFCATNIISLSFEMFFPFSVLYFYFYWFAWKNEFSRCYFSLDSRAFSWSKREVFGKHWIRRQKKMYKNAKS